MVEKKNPEPLNEGIKKGNQPPIQNLPPRPEPPRAPPPLKDPGAPKK